MPEPAPSPPASTASRREAAWFVAATLAPFLLAFLLALGVFAATDRASAKTEGYVEDGAAIVLLVVGAALAVLGWLRRDGRAGQLLLVAAGSLLSSVSFIHSEAPFWMPLPALLLLFAGLALPLWPAARLGHAFLLPLAAIGFLQSLPLGTDSTAIVLLVVAHWILSWLRIHPTSPARRPVAGGLLLLAVAAAALGWYFLVVEVTGRRVVFALGATAVAALLSGLLWHPRLRGLALPARAA